MVISDGAIKVVNCTLQDLCQMKEIIPKSLEEHCVSMARGLTRSCWTMDGKRRWSEWGHKVCSKLSLTRSATTAPLTREWVDKMKSDVGRSRLVCREIKKAKNIDYQRELEDVFSPTPPSEGFKMLMSTVMTGHDDGNHTTLVRRCPQVDLHITS